MDGMVVNIVETTILHIWNIPTKEMLNVAYISVDGGSACTILSEELNCCNCTTTNTSTTFMLYPNKKEISISS